MQIAFVSETYPPEINGVSLFVSRVVQALALHHEVQLIRPRQDADAAPGPATGVREILVPGIPLPRYNGLRVGMPVKRLLARAWARQRPDVVHIATEGPLGWAALAVANEARIPVVADYHTHFPRYCAHYGVAWVEGIAMHYLRRFHNRAWCTLVPSEDTRQELQQRGFTNIRLVGRGVDTVQFNPARREESLRRRWGLAEQDLAVLYVGRIAAEKNLAVVFDAWLGIRSRLPRARLILVGDGPLSEVLQQKFPDAVFCGFRRDADLAAHYASGDLFLFPSLSETYGNVVPEAMASGLPVVAFDYAAASELIESGRSGMLVPLAQPDAFIAAAVQLAGDSQARRLMGNIARTAMDKSSWQAIVQRFEDLLLEAAGAGVRLPARAAIGGAG